MTQEQEEFLDFVRDSGKINMFGAAHILQDNFDLDKHEAKKVLMEWMEKKKNLDK